MAQDPEVLVRDVGRRVAELRRAAGLSQEQLAEALGTSVQYVSRLERGENLTLHTLAKLANAIGVDVVDLFKPPAAKAQVATTRRGRPRRDAT